MLELRQIESFFPEYLRGFKRNLLREYLQYKILDAIFSSRYGQKLAFMGGTFSADIKVEKILIKLDAEPQKFKYTPERVVINKFDVFIGINVVPAGILLAQKFYAILARPRAMGRDFYDAVFLSGKTNPDFAYLKERAGIADKEGLKSALLEHCAKLDFKLLAKDVEQFLFSPDDAKKVLLFLEYVKGW